MHSEQSVALRGTQRHSEALRGTQRHSEALRGTQRHSEALRGTQRQTWQPQQLDAIRRNQTQSDATRRNQTQSDLAEERGQPQQVELRHVDGELLGQRQSIQQLEVVPKIDARGRLWGEGGWGVGAVTSTCMRR